MKKKALGRGLEALLSRPGDPAADAGTPQVLPVDVIVRGQYQPRTTMKPEALKELADSIRAQGVMQPVVVRPLAGASKYEIIAGERRWRAAQLAGLHEVPVVVKEVSEQTAMCLALIENIQREDLNAADEARALARLIKESGMTHAAAAKAIGRSRAAVSNLLRLLDLPASVLELLGKGEIDMGHGRAILALPPAGRLKLARQVAAKGLSVRETEQAVARTKRQGKGKNNKKKPAVDPDLLRLQNDLSERLGYSVRIKHNKQGSGRLEITYNSLDELNGILSRIKQ